MMHDDAVLCAAISRNAEMLATASKSGQIKVWKIMTGKCLRKFEQAHTLPISSLSFLKDGSSLVTGSHDNLLRVHPLPLKHQLVVGIVLIWSTGAWSKERENAQRTTWPQVVCHVFSAVARWSSHHQVWSLLLRCCFFVRVKNALARADD